MVVLYASSQVLFPWTALLQHTWCIPAGKWILCKVKSLMKICLVTITIGKIPLFLLTWFVLELLIFLFSFQSLLYLITFTVSRSTWECPFLSANQILWLPAYEINYLISPSAFWSLIWMAFAHLYLVFWKQPMKLCLSESVGNMLLPLSLFLSAMMAHSATGIS